MRYPFGSAAAVVLTVCLVSAPVVLAVQDPLDQGEADSVFVVLSQPRLGVDSVATVELYYFNDAQSVSGGSLGMAWDNAKFAVDSVVFSPAARDAFSIFRFVFFRNDADSSNANLRIQCSCGGFPADGLPPGSQPKLVATYFFSINNWAAGESFCVDLDPFVATSFVDPVLGEYEVNWRAETCVLAGPDGDGDGVGDDWDNCISIANPGQEDFDTDDVGDLCDLCTDGDDDGYGNPEFAVNTCADDNCPFDYNPDQTDTDGDGLGDACETDCCLGRVGDANGLGGDEPTIGDVAVMIDARFISGTCDGLIACVAEADISQSGGSTPTCADVTVGDISILIDYLFITGPSLGLPDCL